MSNDLEILTEKISTSLLRSQKALLQRTAVILPSNDVKEFLMQSLTKKWGVLFGIRFLTLTQATQLFTKISLKQKLAIPNHLNLMFYLEAKIRSHWEKQTTETTELQTYIQDDPRRIIQIATELSHVFLHYAQYGDKALDSWQKETGWQQILWHEMKQDWDLPAEHLEIDHAPEINFDVHLFHISHIPKMTRRLLLSLSKHWSISHYFLSPSPYFWGDLLNDKKVAYVDKELRNQAISIAQRKDFTQLSKSYNPLLSNMGGHGQSLFLHLHENEVEEHYVPPEGTSSLNRLQNEIYEMERGETQSAVDHSIEVHEAPSPLREVEILLINILRHCEINGISPQEVVVLAPDINAYSPYISYVFGSENSPFGYIVTDLFTKDHSPYLKAVEQFFKLAESRFEPERILKLFSEPVFADKHGFDPNDLTLLEHFIETWNVRFGFNKEMREELLKTKETGRGSFWYGFTQMVESLASLESPYTLEEGKQLGMYMALIEELYNDCKDMHSAYLPLSGFISLMETLITKYFITTDETKFLLQELQRLSSLAARLDTPFTYESFQRVWFEIFNQSGETKRCLQKTPIRFASLAEDSISTAKAIFLLGMDESAFPRQNTYRSLNQLRKDPLCDHQPTMGEKDRYLFLQMINFAKKSLVMSYVGLSQSDGKEQSPSLLIQELSHYLGGLTVKRHPPFPFSHEYFAEKNYNMPYYALAQSRLRKESETPSSWEIIKTTDDPLVINLRHLRELAMHPIQFYCNRALGIYLEKIDKKEQKFHEEIFFSYLNRARLKREGINVEVDELIEKAHQSNSLPSALFKESAKAELHEEITAIKENLRELDINEGEIHTISFDLTCKEKVIHSDALTIYPALDFTLQNGQKVLIHGSIPHVTPKGLVSHGKMSLAELWKELPFLLTLSNSNANIPAAVNFIQSVECKEVPIDAPKERLERYIDYYKKASQSVSPLMPTWVEKTRKKSTKLLQELLTEKKSAFEDPYLDFMPLETDESWETTIEEICENLIV